MHEPQGLRVATDTPVKPQDAGIHPATGPYYIGSGAPASAAVVLAKVIAPGALTAIIWSRIWLGTSAATLATVVTVILLILAPRLFRALANRVVWARDTGFGERVWLNRLLVPVPADRSQRLTVLYLVSWTGTLVAVWGALAGLPVLSLSGLAVAYSAQLTCIVELVTLFRFMQVRHPLYRFWTSSPGNDN